MNEKILYLVCGMYKMCQSNLSFEKFLMETSFSMPGNRFNLHLLDMTFQRHQVWLNNLIDEQFL